MVRPSKAAAFEDAGATEGGRQERKGSATMDQPNPTKQQIRKIQVVSNEELDDQIWPVNLAIIILAGFVTGLVLPQLDMPILVIDSMTSILTI